MEVVKTGRVYLTSGDGVLLSDNVCIVDNTRINVYITKATIVQGISRKYKNIGDNVIVFRNTTVLECVTIRAGSLVNKDVRPYAIVVRSPTFEVEMRS